jgi:iron complex outermembrane receptor protein
MAVAVAIFVSGHAASPVAIAAESQLMALEEVIVTARKRPELLQDVPVAVTVFTGEELDSLVIRDIREVEGYVPNVVIDSVSVAPGAASLYIRGVGTQEVEKSFDPAVGVVVDGVALSFVNGSMANTFDIAAMEILRGPQGTLFGRNTTGGVINITHTRPTGELGMRYEAIFGTDDKNDYSSVLNFPIIQDQLAGKLAFASQNDGGQFQNTLTGDQVGDANNQDYSGTLLWTPLEDFEAQFIYQRYEDKNDGIPLIGRNSLNTDNPVNPNPDLPCLFFQACETGEVDKTQQDFYEPIDYQLDAYTLEMNWEVGPGTITSITGYRDTDENVPVDFDATQYAILHVLRDQQSEQTSSELRFASNETVSDVWDFVVGLYGLKDNYQLKQNTGILESVPPVMQHAQTHTDHHRDSYAVFGEANYNITDVWTLIVGGRWTYEEKDIYADSFASEGVADLSPVSDVNADHSWDEFTPKLGVDYQYTPDVLFYGIYSEGFRSGGYNARNSSPADIGPYDPEYVNQYEAGMKSDLLDQRVRLNLAAFYTDYKDKQEEVIIPDPILGSLTVVRNAATVTTSGIEAEASWVATEALLLNANFGYLDASYDDYEADLNGDGIVTDNSNLQLRRVPDFTGGVDATYTMQIGPGTATAYSAYRYTDEYWVDASNDPRGLVDSRGVIDVTLSYEWEWSAGRMVKITAYGRDITDEQDYNSMVSIPTLLAFSAVGGGEQYGVMISGNF